VAIEMTSTTYLDGRRDKVDHEMKKVGSLLANDQLADVRLRNGRLLITPLRTAVPPEAEELGPRVYEMLRWVRITRAGLAATHSAESRGYGVVASSWGLSEGCMAGPNNHQPRATGRRSYDPLDGRCLDQVDEPLESRRTTSTSRSRSC
jgi:hypothetical protein